MKLGSVVVPILKPVLFAVTSRRSATATPLGAPSRMLLVLPMLGVGDFVLSLPAVENLHRSRPGVPIDVLVKTRSGLDFVSRYFPADRVWRWNIDWMRKPSEGIGIVRLLRKQNYDLVIDFMCDHTIDSAVLSFLVGSHRVAGFSCARREVFFNMTVTPAPHGSHMVDDWNRLVGLTGADPAISRPVLRLSEEETGFARTYLENAGVAGDELLVSVHPGARDDLERVDKRWPADRFGDLCRVLMQQQGVRVAIHGSSDEEELCRRVAERAGSGAIVTCGKTGVLELLSLLGESDLFVGNNSGPLHLAAALGVPTISFSGGVNMVRWGPLGSPKRHRVVTPDAGCRLSRCQSCGRRGERCLQRVGVDSVVDEALKLLRSRPGDGGQKVSGRVERETRG